MARLHLTIAFAAVAALAAVAAPAHAQFGSIFGPPRPPPDVPGSSAPPPPNFPTSRDRNRDLNRGDLPPDEPIPAPMNLPPAQRPGATIQSEPLAPPPGMSNPQQRPAAPLRNEQPPQQAAPVQPPAQRQPRG